MIIKDHVIVGNQKQLKKKKVLKIKLEPATRQVWELTKHISRLRLRDIGDLKPVLKFTEATGAYVCKKSPKSIN